MQLSKLQIITMLLVASNLSYAPEAKANGKSANITAYCNATYNPSGRGLSWRAKYYPGPGQWWCEQATMVGPQTRGGGRKFADPAQICLWAHNTLKVHTHRDMDYAVESNMHCGDHTGLMPSLADMVPASFSLCNDSADAAIGVGYAYKSGSSAAGTSNWKTQGWWEVKKGQCAQFAMPNGADFKGYRGNVRVFGASVKRIFQGRSGPLCVRPNWKFSIDNDDQPQSCKDKKYVLIPTATVKLDGGNERYGFAN
tara:strand:+ start:10337 stop:11098 length:762 start_codon:yes stop_codon:yes gene_type:complete